MLFELLFRTADIVVFQRSKGTYHRTHRGYTDIAQQQISVDVPPIKGVVSRGVTNGGACPRVEAPHT